MDKWIKVYEEPISDEDGNFENYRTWLHEILDDEVIPYEVKIRRGNMSIIPGLKNNLEYIIEFYVNENDVLKVKELIEEFQNSNLFYEHDELNVSLDDLNYDE